MKNQNKNKMYIVRKYVMARDCKEALKLEKNISVHDIFVDLVDQEWAGGQGANLADAIGFSYEK